MSKPIKVLEGLQQDKITKMTPMQRHDSWLIKKCKDSFVAAWEMLACCSNPEKNYQNIKASLKNKLSIFAACLISFEIGREKSSLKLHAPNKTKQINSMSYYHNLTQTWAACLSKNSLARAHGQMETFFAQRVTTSLMRTRMRTSLIQNINEKQKLI